MTWLLLKLFYYDKIDWVQLLPKNKFSSLICGNKMPTKCNRCFYCRSYCLLNIFRASLCPSSGAQEYYTVVAAGVRFAGCCSILQIGHITLSSTPDQQLENHSTKYHRQQPLRNTLELLMMGIVVPETRWASNEICNKNLCCIYLAFYFHILPVILVRFQRYLNFLDRFSVWNPHISNFMKIRPAGAESFHAGGRTEGRDDVNSRFT